MSTTKRSCWYYDNQMLDRMTSVSLHANMKPKEGGEAGDWVEIGGKTDEDGYSLVPLCTSILTEDFQVNIANTWTDNGGDPVGGLWQRTRPFAAYSGLAKDALNEVISQSEKFKDRRINEDKWNPFTLSDFSDGKRNFDIADTVVNAATILYNKIGGEKTLDQAQKYLNSTLISQGTRFTYYSGTGVSFGNLQMRFTMFPIWTNNGNFKTVPQQLENLFPYVMGTYSNVQIFDSGDKDKDFSTLLAWQHPPAGYQATYKDIDLGGLKGTLKLRIGPFYTLESIICENMSFSLSKQMVKRPEKSDGGTKWFGLRSSAVDQFRFSPLFSDVILSLRPATKYSDVAMRKFIYGLNIKGSKNERGIDASIEMEEGLKDEIKRMNDIYGSATNNK